MSTPVAPQLIKVSKISINDSYGTGDPKVTFSATINGKRVMKDQLPIGSLVQGKLFSGHEVTLIVSSFVEESVKNDATKALFRGKAISMPLEVAMLYLRNREVNALEKETKSAYNTAKSQGFIPQRLGDPVAETTAEAPATSSNVSDLF